MAGLWRLYRHRGEDGYRHFTHPYVVYLHLLPDPGLARGDLHDRCFLDEHETVHPCGTPQSFAVFMSSS